ncbi:hypothetical protein [Rhodococcus opacus]|uniref:hypothetical protein n=1 Tax=Rhodococcus opacus TaxID=37919 RepID=UPI002948E1F2|nr:hypothetical protein [Rhodococcus opacus]MDV6246886.1 hypothetical protein [Rhodococcus opacus]
MTTGYTINETADILGVDAADVIDAAGLTLGELEADAIETGLGVHRHRDVPVLTERDLETVTRRLTTEYP